MGIVYIGKCLLIKEKGKKILVVGDLHLGFEESLNESGILVSRYMFKEMIEYFDRVFKKTGKVDSIVLLGDVKHHFGKILKQEWSDVLKLFDYFFKKMEKKGEIIITKGNHDTILEPILRKRENIKLSDYFIFGEYCFLHGDKDFLEMYNKKIRVWIMGHGHPAMKLSDGVKTEGYKSFLVGKYKGKEVIIVPSFIDMREGSDPRENDLGLAWNFNLSRFRVMVVSEDLDVLDFGRLKELR